MKHRFILIKLSRLCIYSYHNTLCCESKYCACVRKQSNGSLVLKLHLLILIYPNFSLLTLFSFGRLHPNCVKHVFKHLWCRRDHTHPQYIPQREMFPIMWQLPCRAPRAVKVKGLTPHKKVKEWVQKIPVYHTRNYQNRQLPVNWLE